MKITYEAYDQRYSIEYLKVDDFTAGELKHLFSRLLVASGFPPSVIDQDEEDGGSYQWVGEDEIIVSKEELKEKVNGRD